MFRAGKRDTAGADVSPCESVWLWASPAPRSCARCSHSSRPARTTGRTMTQQRSVHDHLLCVSLASLSPLSRCALTQVCSSSNVIPVLPLRRPTARPCPPCPLACACNLAHSFECAWEVANVRPLSPALVSSRRSRLSPPLWRPPRRSPPRPRTRTDSFLSSRSTERCATSFDLPSFPMAPARLS